MAENENLASILVKSGLNSIFTDSPIGYFSKFANVLLNASLSDLRNCETPKVSVFLKTLLVLEMCAPSQLDLLRFHICLVKA